MDDRDAPRTDPTRTGATRDAAGLSPSQTLPPSQTLLVPLRRCAACLAIASAVWAFGGCSVFVMAGKMFFGDTKLTFWQKYHFVAGWLPWFADALNLIFTWAGLAWVLAVVLPPLFGMKPVGLPPAEFIAPTIGIFVFKLLYSFGLYFDRVRCTFRQSIGASLAGLALTYTVGRAVIYGLATSRLPFMRTPKMDERATLGEFFRSDFGVRISRLEREVARLDAPGQAYGLAAGDQLSTEAGAVRSTQLDDLMELPLLAGRYREVERRFPNARPDQRLRELVRSQIGAMVNDLLETTRGNIAGIASVGQVAPCSQVAENAVHQRSPPVKCHFSLARSNLHAPSPRMATLSPDRSSTRSMTPSLSMSSG